MVEKIGILGGTFDPPHIGHLILASEAIFQLKLNRILWVLTPNPPHKRDSAITSVTIRKALVLAAIQGQPSFEFCDVDMDREPPHYAVDTLRILRNRHPAAKIIYLMGEDSLFDLPKWHDPEAFLALCDSLGVMRRERINEYIIDLELHFPNITEKIQYIDVPSINVSSSDIKRRVAQGLPYKYFLPEKVYLLIKKNGLYQHG